MTIRLAHAGELEEISALCLRSKGHWGYDAAFLEACREELTLTAADLEASDIGVIDGPEGIAAMAQVSVGEFAALEKLYVDSRAMGLGHGRRLVAWALARAQAAGAGEMVIEADPNAVAFYERMGARLAGSVPSGSIPGRRLPRLTLPLV